MLPVVEDATVTMYVPFDCLNRALSRATHVSCGVVEPSVSEMSRTPCPAASAGGLPPAVIVHTFVEAVVFRCCSWFCRHR